jgi:ATP-dependent DNA ligase
MKRERAGVMLAKPVNESVIAKKWEYIIAQPKLNGNRCKAYLTGDGKCILMSSYGYEITSVPHINRALSELIDQACILDGELHSNAMSFDEASGIVKTRYGIPERSSMLNYYVFDMQIMAIQCVRLEHKVMEELRRAMHTSIYVVPHYFFDHMHEVWENADKIIDGYEGFILRNPNAYYEEKRTSNLMKFKPRQSDYYLIVDTQEEVSIHGEPKNALGAFICINPERGGEQFRIGSGPLLTREARQRLWIARDSLVGQYLGVKFEYLTERGIPRGGSVCFDIINPSSQTIKEIV